VAARAWVGCRTDSYEQAYWFGDDIDSFDHCSTPVSAGSTMPIDVMSICSAVPPEPGVCRIPVRSSNRRVHMLLPGNQDRFTLVVEGRP
jgi:hypothetical protein